MLEYRRVVFVAELAMLLYALTGLVALSVVGFVGLLLGLFLLLLSLSDSVVVCSARQLARLLTLGQD